MTRQLTASIIALAFAGLAASWAIGQEALTLKFADPAG